MNCEYFCEKKTLIANGVEEAQIFFLNGDFFTLTKKEILEVLLNFMMSFAQGKGAFVRLPKADFSNVKLTERITEGISCSTKMKSTEKI